MRKLSLGSAAMVVFSLSFLGCEGSPTEPIVPSQAPAFDASAAPRAQVCHRSDRAASGYRLLILGEAALPAHLAHGDGVVGDAVPGLPGMEFDGDCLPVHTIGILFDNGVSSGPQINYGNTVGVQELFEDFGFSQASVITEVRWQQHDYDSATYQYTELVIFEGLPFDGPPVFSADIVADRTPNATGTLFEHWEGYDYVIEGLSIDLPPGTYWIGLNAKFDGIRSGWDNTTGGANTIPGFRLVNGNFPAPGNEVATNLAFSLSGYAH